GSTVDEAARACGVSTRRVHARVKLLRLSPEIQQVVTTGDFSIGYAQILAESNLDVNRQRVAMQALRKEKSPSHGGFRSVCGERGRRPASRPGIHSACLRRLGPPTTRSALHALRIASYEPSARFCGQHLQTTEERDYDTHRDHRRDGPPRIHAR